MIFYFIGALKSDGTWIADAYIWMASIVFLLLVAQQKHFILLFDKNWSITYSTLTHTMKKRIGRKTDNPAIVWRSIFFLQPKRNFIYDNFQHLSLTDIPNLLLNDRSQQTKYVQSNLWIHIEFTITFALFLTLCAEEFFSCTTLSYCTSHLQCMAIWKNSGKNTNYLMNRQYPTQIFRSNSYYVM